MKLLVAAVVLLLGLAASPTDAWTFPGAPFHKPVVRSVSTDASQRPQQAFHSQQDRTLCQPPVTVRLSRVTTAVLGWCAAIILGAAAPWPAVANDARVVGQLQGSGLVFKDTLQIEAFDDPKIQGVTLYISNFQKPITERLNAGFFNDPSYASVACAQTSPNIRVADNINVSPQGEQVFTESKSLLFKSLRVQRIYDVDKQTAVYVSFNTRLDKSDDSNKSRFKSSLCAVPLSNNNKATVANSVADAVAKAPVGAE
jgi:catabolite regulation protein CreA